MSDSNPSLLQIAELARHPEGSQPYNLAVINLLLRMKERGLDINEMSADGVSCASDNTVPIQQYHSMTFMGVKNCYTA